MGCFDTLNCSGPEFVCSENHDLSIEEFQTKDLGETMGDFNISGNVLTGMDGEWGDFVMFPFTGELNIYCTCTQCPAFVQAKTHNLVGCGVEFKVELVGNQVVKVTRTSTPTEDWVLEEPKLPWMENCLGPMPWEEAEEIHRNAIMPRLNKMRGK
jgi:hypothetical protein